MSAFGRWHRLFVYDIGEPYESLSTHDFADYYVEHGPDCPVVRYGMDPETGWQEHGCAVDFHIQEGGARWLLKYSGCPITEPGIYMIEAWAETIHGFDYTEHDAGIGLVDGYPVEKIREVVR